MRIIFIYENGFASNNGSNHLLCSTIEKMLERGHSVDLIEAVSVHDNPDYPEILNKPGFTCHTVELEPIQKTNFIGRYLYGLKFVNRATEIARNLEADIFFIQSVPTVSFTIQKLKKCHKPIAYNIHDVFPGSAYELGIFNIKLMDIALKQIQRIGFKLATKVFVVSDDMKEKLIQEKTDPDKIEIINTWFDSDTIHYVPDENNTFVKENQIDTSKVIIQYAGNVGQVFGLHEFAALVNELKFNPKVEFHIIGSGVKLDELKRMTNGANIRFFGWQPQSRMSEIYSYCDAEIIPLHHGVIGNNVPSKMALAMACGKPIINIVERSHYYDLFNTNNVGYSFTQDELVEAAKTINESFSNKQTIYEKYHESTVKFTNAMYSKNKNNEKLLDILEKMNDEWGKRHERF